MAMVGGVREEVFGLGPRVGLLRAVRCGKDCACVSKASERSSPGPARDGFEATGPARLWLQNVGGARWCGGVCASRVVVQSCWKMIPSVFRRRQTLTLLCERRHRTIRCSLKRLFDIFKAAILICFGVFEHSFALRGIPRLCKCFRLIASKNAKASRAQRGRMAVSGHVTRRRIFSSPFLDPRFSKNLIQTPYIGIYTL